MPRHNLYPSLNLVMILSLTLNQVSPKIIHVGTCHQMKSPHKGTNIHTQPFQLYRNTGLILTVCHTRTIQAKDRVIE